MLLRGLLDWPENVDHSIQLAQDDDATVTTTVQSEWFILCLGSIDLTISVNNNLKIISKYLPMV